MLGEQDTINDKCPICNNTGMAKCLDFSDPQLNKLSDGEYLFIDLLNEYGYYTPCPDGCQILN